MTKHYCYDHKPVTENVESDSYSDEFHIEIKENVVGEDEDRESGEEKEKLQKKTTFENDNDDAIPKSASQLNKIISYNDTDSDS